ncbi:M16 family metallopeptidase [Thermodesulfobacteriota bacterium]
MFGKRFRHHTVKPFIWVTVIIVFSSLLASIAFKDDEIKTGIIECISKTPSAALAAEHTPVLPEWPHKTSDLVPDPSVLFGRLPNGFRYVLMENQTPRDRVSIHLTIHAGSLQESDDQQGLAHFLEHMLFNGSTHFKPGELVKYFQSIGMEFGPDANAFTGFDYAVYMILLPEGRRESLEQGLIVMKDYAEGALLLQSEIDRERGILLSEKRTRDSASYRTFTSTMKFEFPEARVSKRFPIGIETVLKKADRNSFKDFYDTWYRPDRMTLVMVGDFDIQPTAELIEAQFSTLSARAPPKPDPDFGKIIHKGKKSFYHFEKEAGNTNVSIEVVHRIEKEADSAASRKKYLFRDLANRMVKHRLDALIRKPDTPLTSASIGAGIFLNQIEYAEISGECSPKNWKESLSLLEQTLRSGLKYGFYRSELDRVKKDYLADLDDAVNKASTRNSRSLTGEIRHTINNNLVFLSPEQKRTLLAPFVKSATLKPVQDAFNSVWAPDHRLILVTGNANLRGAPENPENQILAAFNESNGVAVSKPVETKTVTFPYLPEPSGKGQIKSRTFLSDLGIVQIDFRNGLRLNLKKTDFEAGKIQVMLSFGHGRSQEPETFPGLSELSEKVINESGFGSLSKDEVERALAGKKSAVYFRAADDHFSFYGSTVSKELTLFFQLLYTHLADPGFREDAYTLSMERFNQEYQELSRSIDGALTLKGKRFLAGGDSRFGLPPYEAFSKLTLDRVRSWVEAPLKSERLEVSVVGDFEIEPLVEVVSKYLGNIPRRAADTSKKRSDLIEFPRGQSLEIKVETEIPKGIVIVAYPTEDTWDIHRTRRLAVLGNVLSERLREKIREKLGAAYTTFAFNRPSRVYPGYGVLQARVYVDPDEADMVISEVKDIVSTLSNDGIEKDELKRALEPTRTSIKEMRRTNGYWLNTVMAGSERHPEQLDWSRTIMEDYDSITTKDLSSLARKYLINDQAATIVIKPE